MNKFIVVGVILVLIIIGGVIFNKTSDNFSCDGLGQDREFTIVAKKLEWIFEPEEIEIKQCDRVSITVINEDDFDHGFAIDAFGVSQRLPANGTIHIKFVATKSGTFPFYCSVSCSNSDASTFNLPNGEVQSGKYKNTVRGHFKQIGQFVVSSFRNLVEGDDDNVIVDSHTDHTH